MGLFSKTKMAEINKIAEKSKEVLKPATNYNSNSLVTELESISEQVSSYFKDSPAILITDKETLHEYVTECIRAGVAGIDTETTGLDRIHDTIVGASLYYPGGDECYIPMRHLVPIFDVPYKNQLTYEEVGEEFQRLVDENVKLIFANADFDLAMIYKDLKVDLIPVCYYDVILAWRCLKENEKDNALKVLYTKYVLKGAGDPKKFSDFFTAKQFPYCKPEIAKLYAANDAKITYDLYMWQLPYVTKDHPKCKKHHLEAIADLVWNVEFPLIAVCQNMHRTGMYIDKTTANVLLARYKKLQAEESEKLAKMVDEVIKDSNFVSNSLTFRPPFLSGKDFNPKSPPHVKHLVYDLLQVPKGKGEGTGKEVLEELNLPITNQILKVRSLGVLISTFVEKLPKATTSDSRIHARFNSIGAQTGRFSSADPNLQNIPSHAVDIRHMFRATPGYVILSSDYSAQEPRLTAFVSKDPSMIKAFQEGKDVYASIASTAFGVPYENCLEFHPETGEYQPDGKARRGEAKTILLGITYGRSIPSISEQLYGKRDDMDDEEKVKAAQGVFDSVMNAYPNVRSAMLNAQNQARTRGYTETILGRRRHIPDMQLPEFEFKAMKGYVNPDVDPLDPNTLKERSAIPDRIVKSLEEEFKSYKYFGQIARRIRELKDQNIQVINNRPKITEASRKCLNGIIQGSAAEQTKLAILLLESDPRWKEIGGRLVVPVHDELICEVPMEYAEEGGKLLSQLMCDAADFLPFPSKCDVTTTLRWYGEEYPCKYPKPHSCLRDEWSEDEIKWVQYHLREMEYLLPVYKNEDGSKPIGDAAHGINGVWSDEMSANIDNYLQTRNVLMDDFIDTIETEVLYGSVSYTK